MKRIIRCLTVVGAVGGVLAPGFAQNVASVQPSPLKSLLLGETKPPRYRGWQLQAENDALALGKGNGSDRNYTNGLRYTLFYNYSDLVREGRDERSMVPRWVRPSPALWERLRFGDGTTYQGGIAFGHSIYTPQVIRISTPILDDRPYAALLYGTHFVSFIHPEKTKMNFAELQVGWVGEPALGYPIQGGVHALIGDEDPKGWKNQIGFEPIINLNFESAQRIVLAGSKKISRDNVSVDVVPYYSVNLGNLMTRANTGVTLRVGEHIAGFPVMNLGNTTSNITPRSFRWYLFAGVDGHLVAQNIFLDGNTFQKSQSVNKKAGVYDLRYGFDLVYKDWQFNYTFIQRSDEFSPRPAILQTSRTKQNFGSVSITRKVQF